MAFLRFHAPGGDAWRKHTIRRIAKQHALAGLEPSPELVVHDLIGPEVAHFAPLTDDADQIIYSEALSTRPEEHREECQTLSRRIAHHSSAITSRGLACLLAIADFEANNFFFATAGMPADQRPFIALGLTALNIVIAAIGAALIAPGAKE